jgi:hypothetical protein
MMKKSKKSYLEMNAAELAQATSEYDNEFIGVPGKPLTAVQRRQHERARAKIGRPIVGKGHKVISTSMEIGLLRRADALAKRRKIPRAALIAEGLRLILSKAS